jgi:putative membrane protein
VERVQVLIGMGYALLYFAATAVLVFALLAIEERINPAYRLWEQVGQGNVAVGMTIAGKLIGLGIIAMTAITHNAGILSSLLWTAFGAFLQLLVYGLFEVSTPRLNVGRELAAGNRAVGFVSMGIFIGLSLVIAACIA